MTTYVDMIIVAAVVVYVVDLSGFTDTWLGWVSRLAGGRVRSLRPFSCSECMVWWSCLIIGITQGAGLPGVLAAEVLSLLSEEIGDALKLTKTAINAVITTIDKWIARLAK